MTVMPSTPSSDDLNEKGVLEALDVITEAINDPNTVVTGSGEIEDLVEAELGGSIDVRVVEQDGAYRVFGWFTNAQVEKGAPNILLAAAREVYPEATRVEAIMIPKGYPVPTV